MQPWKVSSWIRLMIQQTTLRKDRFMQKHTYSKHTHTCTKPWSLWQGFKDRGLQQFLMSRFLSLVTLIFFFTKALLVFLFSLSPSVTLSLCLSFSLTLSVSPAWSSAVRSLSGRFCLAVLRTHAPWRKDRDRKTDGWAMEIDGICWKLNFSPPSFPVFPLWCS